MMDMGKSRIGKISYNTYNSKMIIKEYISATNITVKFEDGYIKKNINYNDFLRGLVKNPYDKTLYNIGFLGEGKYHAKVNNKTEPTYDIWRNMLQRCYDEKLRNKYPTYKDCKVCNEWRNYQNFL